MKVIKCMWTEKWRDKLWWFDKPDRHYILSSISLINSWVTIHLSQHQTYIYLLHQANIPPFSWTALELLDLTAFLARPVSYNTSSTFIHRERGTIWADAVDSHEQSCIIFGPGRVREEDWCVLCPQPRGCSWLSSRVGALRDTQPWRKASQEFNSSRLDRMLKSLVCFLGKLLTINRCIIPFTRCFLQTRATHKTYA